MEFGKFSLIFSILIVFAVLSNSANALFCGDLIKDSQEECDDGNTFSLDGCDNVCRYEIIYVAPYIGDFDGSINHEWFEVYRFLTDWHTSNNIPLGMTFYPTTMNNLEFTQFIGSVSTNENIELILKAEESFDNVGLEHFSKTQVKNIIDSWGKAYIGNLSAIGYSNVRIPQAYNQQNGRFTNTIRDATRELGYKIYFEQYISELGVVDSLTDYDVMQYSVSFTESGSPGPDEEYKNAERMLREIYAFSSPRMLFINGSKVVTVYASTQDFRVSEDSNEIDMEKLKIYKKVYHKLKNNPHVRFVKPIEIYNLRHNGKHDTSMSGMLFSSINAGEENEKNGELSVETIIIGDDEHLQTNDMNSIIVTFRNSGDSRINNARIQIGIPELGISRTTEPMLLGKGKRVSVNIPIFIPYDVQPGEYLVKISAFSSESRRVHYREAFIE